ncbi:hypothetical protein ANCCAN_12788 [Ancylostoma caninum]|uniref:Uncharacterized protein n=1 Tax=Ancylostoma caninum TaxID=29170 RepID=A0A368GEP1_ANCCA|nr:hypothetical protein ANCCAN_12788 [Ancylostoma caninum]
MNAICLPYLESVSAVQLILSRRRHLLQYYRRLPNQNPRMDSNVQMAGTPIAMTSASSQEVAVAFWT